METKDLKQVIEFKASPHEVYEALMDSKKHSEFSKSKVVISRKVNGKFSAYDGWIAGKNLELVQDKKIVQEWAGVDKAWPKNHISKVTFIFSKTKNGTKLTFTHEGIPEDWFEDISKGWYDQYWEKMKEFFK